MPHIKSINVNLFNGKFNQIIEFTPHLNILSGVNGTGKTWVLKLLKQGSNVTIEPSDIQFNQVKVIALSPKRNAEKRNIQSLILSIRNTNLVSKLQELLNKQIRDETYDPYPSFAELFCLKFEKLKSINFDSKTQQQILDDFTNEVNENVIKICFPGYTLSPQWNENSDSLDLKIYKEFAKDYVAIENLSTGEQELLSLVFNIYLMREEVDVFLIDEPEIHLNWTLEQNLFDFLVEFSERYNKQIIVSTHSRIIFYPEFVNKITYLVWENGEIMVKKEVPKDYKEKIAGESVALLTIAKSQRKTIFVEDDEHEITIQTLVVVFGKSEDSLEIIKLSGGSGNIENLYKVINQNPNLSNDWISAYFLRDGDNESSGNRQNFIKLKKYSIESYYFDLDVLSLLLNREKGEIKELIIKTIKDSKEKIAGKSKNSIFFERLIESLEDLNLAILDNFDCSQFFDEFLKEIDYKKHDFMKKYIEKANELGKLEEIFDKELIDFVKNL